MKLHFGKYLGATLIDESQPLSVWRTWRLGERGQHGGPVVLTATWKQSWAWEGNGSVTVAECLAEQKSRCNVTMRPDCDCGLWGAVALTNLLKHGAVALYPTGILGRASLWGFVHVYEFGFRASMGRPTAGWLGSSAGRDAAERIAEAYRMPVEIGLPVEVVADPDMLSPKKVLAAASTYIAAQTMLATRAAVQAPLQAPERIATQPARGRQYRCSGCGRPGHPRRTCPECSAKKKSVKV